MSLNCRIVRNPINNNVERVEAPNGEESLLYKSALNKFNDAKTALNVWAVSSLTSFKEQVMRPILPPQNKKTAELVTEYLKSKGQGINILSEQEMVAEARKRGYENFDAMVKAYHGSPYKFDKFSTSKMGTGEGAQAFGWGLYFTDLKGVAENYADVLTNEKRIEDFDLSKINNFKDLVDFDYYQEELKYLSNSNRRGEKAIEELKSDAASLKKQLKDLSDSKEDVEFENFIDRQITIINSILNQTNKYLDSLPSKNVYEVSLFKNSTPKLSDSYKVLEKMVVPKRPIGMPKEEYRQKVKDGEIKPLQTFNSREEAEKWLSNEDIASDYYFLEWDKAKGDYSNIFKNYVESLKREYPNSSQFFDAKFNEFREKVKDLDGKTFYEGLLLNTYRIGKSNATAKDVSLKLNDIGVDGIKYPAESISRGTTSDNARGFNYVVFDENAVTIDSNIQFLEQNDKIYGFYDNNTKEIYLTDEVLSSENLTHELFHAFAPILRDKAEQGDQTSKAVLDRLENLSMEMLGGVESLKKRYKASKGISSGLDFSVKSNFEKWKGKNKIVEGSEVQEVKTGQPIVVRGYHGTTNEFYEFDSSVKGNIEGHLGKVNYFTTDYQDAAMNYQADGADITGRIDIRADQIEQQLEEDLDILSFEGILEKYKISEEELKELYPEGIPKDLEANELSYFLAERELKGGTEQVLELYVKLNNPAVIGKGMNYYDFTNREEFEDYIEEATEEIVSEYDITEKEAKDDYLWEIETRAMEIAGYENPLIGALSEAIENNTYDYERAGEKASEILADFYDSDISLNQLEKALREGLTNETNEEGDISSSQIISDFFKNLGFDGIILTDVSQRFSGMKLGDNTSHIHVFDEYNNQIKLADGSNVDFGETSDIRYMAGELSSEVYNPRENESFEQYKSRMIEEASAILLQNNSTEYFEKIAEANGLNETETKSFLQRVKDFIKSFGEWIIGQLGIENTTPQEVANLTQKELFDRITTSMLRGDYSQEVKLKYNEKGQHLAPNDKPSNLTEKQAKLVRTPAFKNWFGDWENSPQNASKVVDENGEPMVVYHGTPSGGFTIFNRDNRVKESGIKEKGLFFTTNTETAKNYTRLEGRLDNISNLTKKIKEYEDIRDKTRNNREFDYYNNLINKMKRGEIFEVFLNIRDIKNFDAKENFYEKGYDNVEIDLGYKVAKGQQAIESILNGDYNRTTGENTKVFDGIKVKNIIESSSPFSGKEQIKKAKDEGLLGTTFIVKTPNQIKSATDNIGTFDPNNNDIRYQIQMQSTQYGQSAINYSKQGNLIVLEEIKTSENYRGQGLARKALQNFLKAADEEGATVKLVVSPRDKQTSQAKLEEFYMSEGFQFEIENGVPSSFEMVRYPNLSRKKFDKNGEPLLKTVLNFIEENKDVKELSQKDIFDIEDMIISENLTDSSDISKELNKIFSEGTINVLELQNSKLFSGSEVANILQNKEYQDALLELKDKLNSLDTPINVSYYTSEDPFVVLSGEINKYGKNAIINPMEVQEDLQKSLGGIRDIDDFTEAVNNLEYSDIIEKYNTDEDFKFRLYSQFSGLSKMDMLTKDLMVADAPNRTTETTETLDLTGTNFSEDIEALNEASSVWEDSRMEIIDALTEIEEKSIEAGMDLEGLIESYDSKDSTEILSFLNSLSALEQNTTEESFNNFLEEYSDFFEVTFEPMSTFENMGVAHKDKTLVKIEDSNLSEYDLFNDNSLVKVAPGTYQRVDKVSFEDMLEITYAEASSRDNRILPNEAYFMDSNVVNNSYLADEANKETIIENIRIFVEDNVGSLDLNKDQFDFDVAYNLYLYKQVFENPLTVKPEEITQTEQKLSENFEGDYNYLTTDYVSDFQKQKLKEKRLDSEKYNEVYKYFNINSLGILPNYNNKATKDRVKESAQRLLTEKEYQNLADYFKLNKNSSYFEEAYDPTFIPSLNSTRLVYQNNPTKLQPYKGEYQRVKDRGVTAFNTNESFIRINDKIYEKTQEQQGQAFYEEIPVFNSDFFVVANIGEVNKFDYNTVKNYIRSQKNNIKTFNKYSEEQLESIEENHFNCN